MRRAALILLSCGILAACTDKGLKARKEAGDRFDKVHAGMLYEQAEQSYCNGKLSDALLMTTQLVTRWPEDRKYRLLRGRVAMEMNKLELALQDFEACQCDEEACAPCWYFAGIASERAGDFERAVKSFGEAAKLDPEGAQYGVAEAEVLLRMGRMDEAKALVADLQQRFSYSAIAHELSAEAAALAQSEEEQVEALRRVSLLARDEPLVLEQLAHAEFRAGNWGQCLDVLERMDIAGRPDIARLQARCLLASGQGVAARDLLLTQRGTPGACTLDYWVLLGQVAWSIGDGTRLEMAAAEATADSPASTKAALVRGLSEYRKGNYPEALDALDRASTGPDAPDIARRLAAACRKAIARESGGTSGA